MHEKTTENILSRAREQVIELEETIDDDSLIGIFQKAIIHAIDNHIKLISGLNNLVIGENQDLGEY